MSISIFDLFSIGIGPSSSHTVGPMRAANQFVTELVDKKILKNVSRVKVTVHGSLAFTGKGHGTDIAILMGLSGEKPDTIDPLEVSKKMQQIHDAKRINLLQQHEIAFDPEQDLILDTKTLMKFHSNGMRFVALDENANELANRVLFSVGGGFVVDESVDQQKDSLSVHVQRMPFSFKTFKELENYCNAENKTISQIVFENEITFRDKAQIQQDARAIWNIMEQSIERGCNTTGILPGGLKVKRRAAEIFAKLTASEKNSTSKISDKSAQSKPSTMHDVAGMDWISVYAIAVNEENAAGGKIVTAPTNGAAGVIPAVIKYYFKTHAEATDEKLLEFMLTAGAVGILYKEGASISAAEVGCQGEVGVACSMAAAGLAAVLGGTLKQIENAAEIGMEHHLGLTCDPVAGLVQIPCIERNAMGAVQAVNSTRLALLESGKQSKISLDRVIKAMRDTGKDMSSKYKETSLGGLAKNIPEC